MLSNNIHELALGALVETTIDMTGDVTVQVSGEIDISNSPELSDHLLAIIDQCDRLSVTMDLTALGFVDSTGLGAFVRVRKRALRHTISLDMRPPDGPAMKPFVVTGLDKLFFDTDE